MSRQIPLVLFAKAPIPGQVKTRLQTNCSATQAADIAQLLLESSLKTALKYWPGDVYLSSWLDLKHPSLVALSRRFEVDLVEQCDGSLGAKMQGAFDSFSYPAAIMGCDAPHVTEATLVGMHDLLGKGKSAIAPSLDGGYYLIGLSEPAPWLFKDMPWGTSTVLALTIKRAEAARFGLNQLDPLQDIDEWDDLLLAQNKLPSIERYLRDQGLV